MQNARKSRVKRRRKSGFLARTRTTKGRKILNRKRRIGRSCNIRNKVS
jgi:ribosomal protein L34